MKLPEKHKTLFGYGSNREDYAPSQSSILEIMNKQNAIIDYLEENQWQRDNVYAEGFNVGKANEKVIPLFTAGGAGGNGQMGTWKCGNCGEDVPMGQSHSHTPLFIHP